MEERLTDMQEVAVATGEALSEWYWEDEDGNFLTYEQYLEYKLEEERGA